MSRTHLGYVLLPLVKDCFPYTTDTAHTSVTYHRTREEAGGWRTWLGCSSTSRHAQVAALSRGQLLRWRLKNGAYSRRLRPVRWLCYNNAGAKTLAMLSSFSSRSRMGSNSRMHCGLQMGQLSTFCRQLAAW